ncbi:MAG: MFS transporter [Anaerolineae bacterium]
MTNYSRIARKITATLFLAQSLGSAGFIAAAAINSIVGAELSGQRAWAGVPAAVYLLGAALSAFAWGYAMDRIGRRGSLGLGLMLGVVGAGLAGGAVMGRSFFLLLAGLALMGVANAALQLGRFVAAEVHPPAERGRAISNVVIGGTVGAVFGPLLVGPTGRWAVQAGLDELVGPYAAGLLLFGLASAVILLWLRPDPRDIGRQIARLYPETVPHQGPTRSVLQILREPAAIVAVTAMVVGQMVMVMLMVITALHMKDHKHSLTAVSLVFSSHTLGMYAFSIFSGRLTDRWGRGPVILAGAGTLILASLLAPLSPNVLPLVVALFLLGLGWNFCYVGGSSLLADQLSPAERARTQGFNDMLIGLASAMGSLGSGIVFAALGFGVMGIVGVVASLVPLGLTLWWQVSQHRLAMA